MKLVTVIVSVGLLWPTSVVFRTVFGIVAVDATACDNPRQCPCSYAARSRERSRSSPPRVVLHSANETLAMTQLVLQRIVNERFRGNELTVRRLQDCLRSMQYSCLNQHLQGDCQMTGMPSIHHVERLSQHSSMYSEQELLRETQNFLSRLAVYVDHAKRDEEQHVVDPMRSLASDIERIENDGIYQLMCDMQVSDEYPELRRDPTVSHALDVIRCAFRQQVSRDNRNYIVFYTLARLLHSIGR